MRVMCITNQWYEENEEASGPKYGEICEVVDRVYDDDRYGYILEGYDEVYEENGFIPLSDIDETERIEEVLEEMFVTKE